MSSMARQEECTSLLTWEVMGKTEEERGKSAWDWNSRVQIKPSRVERLGKCGDVLFPVLSSLGANYVPEGVSPRSSRSTLRSVRIGAACIVRSVENWKCVHIGWPRGLGRSCEC